MGRVRAALALTLACGALLGGGMARAQEIPAYDIGPIRDALRLFTDGKGHFVAQVPRAWCLPASDKLKEAKLSAVFYGDGKVFHHLRRTGGGSICEPARLSTYTTLWEPRVASRTEAQILFREGKHLVVGGKRETELRPVAEAEGRERIARAKFLEQRWRRSPYSLTRDAIGTYYFVDTLGQERPGRDFRLYAGPRGNLKLQPMKNVVSDSQGDIFSTKRGELRLVLSRSEFLWIVGQKQTRLVNVPLADNQQLIYAELGPYMGERLGTPCDDL
jgi:hypothetical protein